MLYLLLHLSPAQAKHMGLSERSSELLSTFRWGATAGSLASLPTEAIISRRLAPTFALCNQSLYTVVLSIVPPWSSISCLGYERENQIVGNCVLYSKVHQDASSCVSIWLNIEHWLHSSLSVCELSAVAFLYPAQTQARSVLRGRVGGRLTGGPGMWGPCVSREWPLARPRGADR